MSNATQAWEQDNYVSQWPEMRPFWAAAAEGRFLLPKCASCGKHHWHPRALCPFCRSDKIEWVPASGRGSIYSYSIARTWTPQHVVAFVRVEEGPVLLTQVIDCEHGALRIGLPVRVTMKPVDGGRSLPFFAPA